MPSKEKWATKHGKADRGTAENTKWNQVSEAHYLTGKEVAEVVPQAFETAGRPVPPSRAAGGRVHIDGQRCESRRLRAGYDPSCCMNVY